MEDSRPHHPNVQETRNLEVLIGTVGAVHPLPLLYSTVIQKEKQETLDFDLSCLVFTPLPNLCLEAALDRIDTPPTPA